MIHLLISLESGENIVANTMFESILEGELGANANIFRHLASL